ncbi:transposase [Janthinobacterium sp. CG_S6]|uniref:transposase n=1 Tax=unclassified Janthinobacterium TaxID=2610881 RepID=UPI0009DA2DE7
MCTQTSIIDTKIQPGQRALTRGSYRRHSDELKQAIVTQSLPPNASVSGIARKQNISANQMFAWRELLGGGQLAPSKTACALLPVRRRARFVLGKRQHWRWTVTNREHSED